MERPQAQETKVWLPCGDENPLSKLYRNFLTLASPRSKTSSFFSGPRRAASDRREMISTSRNASNLPPSPVRLLLTPTRPMLPRRGRGGASREKSVRGDFFRPERIVTHGLTIPALPRKTLIIGRFRGFFAHGFLFRRAATDGSQRFRAWGRRISERCVLLTCYGMLHQSPGHASAAR